MNTWIGEDLLKPGGKKIHSEKKKNPLPSSHPLHRDIRAHLLSWCNAQQEKSLHAGKCISMLRSPSYKEKLKRDWGNPQAASKLPQLNGSWVCSALSAQAQLFRTNPTSIKHQEVSDGNGLCSEETELTKPTLSKASVIWVSLSAGACVFATAVLGSFLPLKPNLNWAWISAGAKWGSLMSFLFKTQELDTRSRLALCLSGISQWLCPLGAYM